MFWMNLNNLMIFMPSFFNLLIILTLMMPSKLIKIHPFYLFMILIMSTFLICIKMNFLMKSLIPYMLFLMMIGGLMIIFLYMTSLANNEMFSFNLKSMLINYLKILPIMILFLSLMLNNKSMMLFMLDSFQIMKTLKFNELIHLNMNSIYEMYNNKSTYFIMLYLFYTMICLMNICFKLKAPLRQLTF